ncbi:MAG TPA: tRNA dihydrouridine synthase DusB [Desulfobulbaceae bacterium]|nr:tRNA dihydrouridine synthase DusB [Desulfobulbaceae bacterium]
MQLGSVPLQSPFILAPLAGYTDVSFRLLCREQGAGLCYSEMISCHGLVYGQEQTRELLATVPEERPVAFQLFGSDPQVMGEAAAIISRSPIDAIDINMGCPVRKVTRKGAGVALMKNFSLAEAIIRSVCVNTSLPVSVKFRSGVQQEAIIASDFARMAEGAGASALIVHGRTWSQGFGGTADWQVIAQVRKSVSVPVIGNGDILTYQDGLRMMTETGCDAVMIGRGALGNPWVFKAEGRPPTLAARKPVILRHLALIERFLPERKAVFKSKHHLARYLCGLPGATRLRRQITGCTTLAELRSILEEQ